METKKTTSKSVKVFLCSLVVLLTLSILNWGILSSWGKIRITRIYLNGDNGMIYSALMYEPKTATNESPAPAILLIHGNSGNARNHENQAIEFARRGFIALSVDNQGGGDTEYSQAIGNQASPRLFTDYLYSLPNVDTENVAMTGHSMGGDILTFLAVEFQPRSIMIQDFGGMQSEGAYNGNVQLLVGDCDPANALPDYKVKSLARFTADGIEMNDPEIEVDKVYGSYAAGNAHVLTVVKNQIHETPLTNTEHIAKILEFAQQTMDVPNEIDGYDQVWQVKEFVGLAAILAFVFTLMALAVMLMDTVPFFASVKQPLPRNIGMRKIELAVSIAAAVLFPLLTLYTGAFGLMTAIGGRRGMSHTTPIFQVHFTNIAFSIVIAMNIFGLIMFLVYHFTCGKKQHNATLADYGLTSAGKKGLDWSLIGKSALLAILVAVIGFSALGVQTRLLGTDLYSLYFGYKNVPVYKLIYYIPYMIGWALCFIITSLGMNVERRLPSTGSETKDTVIACLFNGLLAAFTITVVVIIHYFVQLGAGAGPTFFNNFGVQISRIWGMPLGMFIAGVGNTYLFRKTGSIWPGVFLMGIVCALSACLYGQIVFA